MGPQRIVGYCGFLPGQQHLHGETYGHGAGTTLRERADENNSGKYLTSSDTRWVQGTKGGVESTANGRSAQRDPIGVTVRGRMVALYLRRIVGA